MPSITIALRIPNTPPGVNSFLLKVVEDTVRYRERCNVKRNDFMQLLIEPKSEGSIDADVQDKEKLKCDYHQ